jgi:Flp pilus assembly protein TadG
MLLALEYQYSRKVAVRTERRIGGERRGQSLVETALTFVLFMMLVFGILDFARLFYVHLTMQHALRVAGRYAATGNHQTAADGSTTSRTNSIVRVAQNAAMGLPLTSIQFTSQSFGSGSAGGPCDTVTMAIGCNVQLLTPLISRIFSNGVYRFNASMTFRNEPFPPAQTN